MSIVARPSPIPFFASFSFFVSLSTLLFADIIFNVFNTSLCCFLNYLHTFYLILYVYLCSQVYLYYLFDKFCYILLLSIYLLVYMLLLLLHLVYFDMLFCLLLLVLFILLHVREIICITGMSGKLTREEL